MWQSKGDSILRRCLDCDLCLPPECLAMIKASYDALVRCYNRTGEGSLTAPRKPTSCSVHSHAPFRRRKGTLALPCIYKASRPMGNQCTGHRIVWPLDLRRPSNNCHNVVVAAVTMLPLLPPPVKRRSPGQLLPPPPPCPTWFNCFR